MAETNVPVIQQQSEQSQEEKLKYLEFVQVAVLHAVMYASKVYGFAKDKSGPLKPGVETIEGTLKTVVAPAYDRFHDIPVDFLKFIDRKVDESVHKLDCHVPPIVKQVSNQTISAASEVKNVGVVGTASVLAKSTYNKYEATAKEVYFKYEPVAEQYAVLAWRSLNQLPLFPKVVNMVIPTAVYYSEKYNQAVQQTAEKGYKVSPYLPLVPTGKIAKMFGSA